MTKSKWTIWSIKNRWLRTAVAWVLFIVGAVVLAIIAFVLTAIVAIAGALAAIHAAWKEFMHGFHEDARDGIVAAARAALTGKDAPV